MVKLIVQISQKLRFGQFSVRFSVFRWDEGRCVSIRVYLVWRSDATLLVRPDRQMSLNPNPKERYSIICTQYRVAKFKMSMLSRDLNRNIFCQNELNFNFFGTLTENVLVSYYLQNESKIISYLFKTFPQINCQNMTSDV